MGWWVPVVTGVLALMVSTTGVLPRSTRVRRAAFLVNALSTTVHEAGHALAAIVTGGGVWVIRVHTPDSGVTSIWYPSQLSSIAISAAGYAAPPLAGLGIAYQLSHGHAPQVLTLTVAVMLLIFVVTRDLVTLACVLTIGAVAFSARYWGPLWLQTWVVYAEAWLLLLGEIAGLWAVLSARIGGYDPDDDAASLAHMTHIPAVLWIAGWATLIGWAVWTAIPMLWI
jgi:hypothetical protein